jgi:hypothetical protein
MHHRLTQNLFFYVVAPGLLLLSLGSCVVQADDSGFFGRLFRFGGKSASSANTSTSSNRNTPVPYNSNSGNSTKFTQSAPSNSSSSGPSSNNGLFASPPATPPTSSTGPLPRLTPKPRVSSAVTSADPVLTRFALGRSNDGSQFAMALQIFSDGTVIDSEGVHRLRAADLRPIFESVQSGELDRLRGHCGAPGTDYIEYVHIIVFERRMGRLMAHAFSYSGNPQGCDHAVRHLHIALENLQQKLSRQPATGKPAASVPAALGVSPLPAPLSGNPGFDSSASGYRAFPTRQPVPPPANPGRASSSGSVIPLTPLDQSH